MLAQALLYWAPHSSHYKQGTLRKDSMQKGTFRKKSGNYSFFYVTLFFNNQASKKIETL